jgi:hypothetical protein
MDWARGAQVARRVNKSFALEGHELVRAAIFQQNLEGNLDE